MILDYMKQQLELALSWFYRNSLNGVSNTEIIILYIYKIRRRFNG